MPVIPVDYRADNNFEPQTKIKDIDRLDFAASAGLLTGEIIRVGHWVQVVGDGVDRPQGAEVASVACFPAWVEWDFDEVAGFPDANRLDQITCLVGPHRAKTVFYDRVAPPVAGNLLSVKQAASADVTAIGAAKLQTGDGILMIWGGADAQTPVARCLSVSGGYLEYVSYWFYG